MTKVNVIDYDVRHTKYGKGEVLVSLDGGLVVLSYGITGNGEFGGIVLRDKSSNYSFGSHQVNWETSKFKWFNGRIEINTVETE